MRVLFVDDEPLVLQGIERKLFHRCDDWDIVCVDSVAEALAELADEPFDVVVSDMRMPGMDGAQLLIRVKESYPQVVRVVLSGYTELEATIRAVRVAHQFLTKPCEPDAIERVINRSVELQKFLGADELRAVVGDIKALPSLPQAYTELTVALADETCNIGRVVSIIERDPAMSAKLLQLVNSSFFTRSAPTTDTRQAILRLGFEMIKNLALAVEVFSARRLPAKLRHKLSLETLQHRALVTAGVARGILDDRRLGDDAFTAAMLQDVGLLLLAAEMPDQLIEALELAESEDMVLREAERKVIGASHAEVGAYLLGTWGLPYTIVEAVAHHHCPANINSNHLGTAEAVYIANQIVDGQEPAADYLASIGLADCNTAPWRQLAHDVEEHAA